MPANRAKQQNKIGKGQQILDAASQLFLQRGLQDVSVTDIVKASGVSRETVYRYYKNKDDIFETVISQQINTFLSTMDSLSTGESNDLQQGLLFWAKSLVKTVSAESYIQLRRMVIADAVLRDKHAKLYFEHTYNRGSQAAQAFFANQLEQGMLKPIEPKQLTRYFVGMLLYDLMHRRILGVMPVPTDVWIEQHCNNAVNNFLLAYASDKYDRRC
jgi:AcrR family transcriptional regulator